MLEYKQDQGMINAIGDVSFDSIAATTGPSLTCRGFVLSGWSHRGFAAWKKNDVMAVEVASQATMDVSACNVSP